MKLNPYLDIAPEVQQALNEGKPVVALVVGRHAPTQRRMGHAGTLAVLGGGTADAKVRRLQDAGAVIARNADQVAGLMQQALGGT